MALSRSECIRSVLDSMRGKKEETSVLNETSVFLLHLLYIQLSGANPIPADDLCAYLVKSGYEEPEIREWLSAYRIGKQVDEVRFILVCLSVFSAQSHNIHQEKIQTLLSHYPLSPVPTGECDWSCVISFAELQAFYQRMSELSVQSLWRIPVQSVVSADVQVTREL